MWKKTIQFSISMRFNSIWSIDRTLSGATTQGPKWTWEQWRWNGTLHFPKLQNYWNLTIRLYSVINRTLIRWSGVLPLCWEAVSVFYSSSWLGNTLMLRGTILKNSEKLHRLSDLFWELKISTKSVRKFIWYSLIFKTGNGLKISWLMLTLKHENIHFMKEECLRQWPTF